MSEVKGKTGSFSIGEKKPGQEYFVDSYGNRYTDHAVAGMQPSGHRYGNADGGSGIIYYRDSRGHVVDGSSIPAMCVDNCLKNGTRTESFRDGKKCYVYLHDGIEVVTNAEGVVITTTKKD